MTVEELIIELLKCNQKSTVCTGGNEEIEFTEELSAYWDGRLKRRVRDEDGKRIGIEITASGSKVKLHHMDIEDELYDSPKTLIKSADNPMYDAHTLKIYAGYRQEGLDSDRETNKMFPEIAKLHKKDEGHLFIWDTELESANEIFNKERMR